MSSISVVHHPFAGGSTEQSSPFNFPYSSSEYSNEGSSSVSATFTVNPASSRPPSTSASSTLRNRTPRTSIVGNSTSRPASMFEMSSYTGNAIEETDNAIELASSPAESTKSVRGIEVWREIFLTSTGRDKALKLIQYSIRVYLLFHLRSSKYFRRQPQKAWEADMITGLQKAYGGLSLSRKCMILFNWLGPLSNISTPESLPATSSKGPAKSHPQPFLRKMLHSPPPVLLDLLCGLSDDLATFYKLGLVPRRIGQRAESLADWCWFAGTLVDLVEVGVELSVIGSAITDIQGRLYTESMSNPAATTTTGQATDEEELVKLRRQQYWCRVQRMKLLMDLIFVSYDVFHLKKYSDVAKSFSGLASAVLSSMKLYDKHQGSLSRSLV
ncbi:hypothetical protein CPB86DRAFT_778404 [Serendipita vermifera]|nr:hypothetical protein CPB86DRAFT_778404 [Serendipita vermifera]